jgi:short-subunit dehydrogenase
MTKVEKALLLGTAGLLAYVAARRAPVDQRAFYRGKAVVVTGGASGIGLALVERLWNLGARVLAVDIDGEALAALHEALPGVATHEVDLAGHGAPADVVATAVERLGGLEILFSNAGVVWAAPFLSMTDADIERLVEVNFTMQVRMTHTVVPFMLAHGGGVIAYTGSLSSYVYSPMHSVYTGTKGGLNNFVHAVRREIEREGDVQLTIVHPNMTKTSLAAGELFDEISRSYHLQTAEQVAAAFLQGVADGRREVFVEAADHFWIWLERLAPAPVGMIFKHAMTDELIELAEEAIPTSKLRAQIAGRAD